MNPYGGEGPGYKGQGSLGGPVYSYEIKRHDIEGKPPMREKYISCEDYSLEHAICYWCEGEHKEGNEEYARAILIKNTFAKECATGQWKRITECATCEKGRKRWVE